MLQHVSIEQNTQYSRKLKISEKKGKKGTTKKRIEIYVLFWKKNLASLVFLTENGEFNDF